LTDIDVWSLRTPLEPMHIVEERKKAGVRKIECTWRIENRMILWERPSVSVSIALNTDTAAHGDLLMALRVKDENGTVADENKVRQITWIIQAKQLTDEETIDEKEWNENWPQCHKKIQALSLDETQWVLRGNQVVWLGRDYGDVKRREEKVGCAHRVVGLRPYLKLREKWFTKMDNDDVEEESCDEEVECDDSITIVRKRKRDDCEEEE